MSDPTPRALLIATLDEGGYEWEAIHDLLDKVVRAEGVAPSPALTRDSDELRKAAMLAVHDNWPRSLGHYPGCDTMQEAVSRALLSAGDKAKAPRDE